MKRDIIRIDEEKCNGCGLCVPACAEGAIRIVDGKARLMADHLCDGLGSCLGHCPRNAITVEQREADAFDQPATPEPVGRANDPVTAPGEKGSCPSARAAQWQAHLPNGMQDNPSRLTNWPVQLHLISATAPFLRDADLLLAADCAPFAYADFHRELLAGKTLLIGCPKLDDSQAYLRKLTAILAGNAVRSLTVVHMEVPCCSGLLTLARQALADSGRDMPLRTIRIGINGQRQRPANTSAA
jgi:NAD-dependent dihydropyrimidine dehydrogenase PreA subunit